VLRGEESLELRRDSRPEARGTRAGAGGLTGAELVLWEVLRTWRLDLAREQGVPPYVIFHDTVLLALVRERPDSLPRLGQIEGVGERKLAKYGADLLAILGTASGARHGVGVEGRG
jgi:ATP-dependent DNA helicase RecQ